MMSAQCARPIGRNIIVSKVWSIVKGMFGKTGRTAKVRSEEHRTAYIKKRNSSNLWDHVRDMHQGLSEEVEF